MVICGKSMTVRGSRFEGLEAGVCLVVLEDKGGRSGWVVGEEVNMIRRGQIQYRFAGCRKDFDFVWARNEPTLEQGSVVMWLHGLMVSL